MLINTVYILYLLRFISKIYFGSKLVCFKVKVFPALILLIQDRNSFSCASSPSMHSFELFSSNPSFCLSGVILFFFFLMILFLSYNFLSLIWLWLTYVLFNFTLRNLLYPCQSFSLSFPRIMHCIYVVWRRLYGPARAA